MKSEWKDRIACERETERTKARERKDLGEKVRERGESREKGKSARV